MCVCVCVCVCVCACVCVCVCVWYYKGDPPCIYHAWHTPGGHPRDDHFIPHINVNVRAQGRALRTRFDDIARRHITRTRFDDIARRHITHYHCDGADRQILLRVLVHQRPRNELSAGGTCWPAAREHRGGLLRTRATTMNSLFPGTQRSASVIKVAKMTGKWRGTSIWGTYLTGALGVPVLVRPSAPGTFRALMWRMGFPSFCLGW